MAENPNEQGNQVTPRNFPEWFQRYLRTVERVPVANPAPAALTAPADEVAFDFFHLCETFRILEGNRFLERKALLVPYLGLWTMKEFSKLLAGQMR